MNEINYVISIFFNPSIKFWYRIRNISMMKHLIVDSSITHFDVVIDFNGVE